MTHSDATERYDLRVGEAAARAGLSVRALHHYEQAGLLQPARTSSGRRRYSSEDVRRLLRIANLRRLGLAVQEIKSCLEAEPITPRRLLELRLDAMRERAAQLELDARHLEAVLLESEANEDGGPFDLWTAVDTLAAVEEHLDPDQYATWTAERRSLGPGGIRARQRTFTELVNSVRDHMERGMDPSHDSVRQLARRWEAFAQETYAHDPALRASMAIAVSRVPGLAERLGVDRELLRYVGRALSS